MDNNMLNLKNMSDSFEGPILQDNSGNKFDIKDLEST